MSEILTEDGAVYMVVDALYHVATLFGTVLNVRNIFFMSNKRGSKLFDCRANGCDANCTSQRSIEDKRRI